MSCHDEYIKHDENALVVPTGQLDKVVEALWVLLNDPNELNRLKKGALNTAASWPSWEDSSKQFAEWLESTVCMHPVDKKVIAELTATAFKRYEQEEKKRIQNNPAITRRYKLSAFAAKLPAPLVRRLKALEAVAELVFGGNKVY